jgi:hypothetical protein
MQIKFNGETFSIDKLSLEEFEAIREFMKLARLTADNVRFTMDNCNTADKKRTDLGRKLSDQLRDFR